MEYLFGAWIAAILGVSSWAIWRYRDATWEPEKPEDCISLVSGGYAHDEEICEEED